MVMPLLLFSPECFPHGKLVFAEHFKLTFAARRRVCHSFSVHWKRKATLFLDIRFFGCFFRKCRGVECVREVDNKSQSASLVNAIIILKALEAVFE